MEKYDTVLLRESNKCASTIGKLIKKILLHFDKKFLKLLIIIEFTSELQGDYK